MDWITDRPPTRADADAHGDVVVGTSMGDGWDMTEWYNVPESTPWLAFKPADVAAAVTAPTASQPRRIVSIALTDGTLSSVADDGTAWWLSADGTTWTQLPALPDRG